MKQLRGHIFVAGIIIVTYIILALWFDRAAIRQHEKDFNAQQALQIQLSARSIEDHFEWLQGEMILLGQYTLPHYLRTGYSAESVTALFEARAQTVYSDEELMIGFFTDPDTSFALYVNSSATPSQAEPLLKEWLSTYWETVEATQTLFVTPFTVLEDRQIYGILLPVFTLTNGSRPDTFQGIMVTMLNFEPVLERYVIPVRSGDFGAAWVHDAEGLVIYDHEPETVGDNVLAISEPYPDLRRVIDTMQIEDSGQDEYRYTVRLGGDVKRKLVAWSTVYLGNQRLTMALSAPDSEINANMTFFRGQVVALGVLLTVALVASSSLIFLNRNRNLTRLVTERTRELEDLTAKLEQRVARRTHQLDQERAQLKTILEAMTDGVIFRKQHNVVYVNSRLSDLTGYTMDEILADPESVFTTVTSSLEPAQMAMMGEKYRRTVQSQGVWRIEGQLTRKDGTLFDAGIYLAEVRDADGQLIGHVEIIRDTTREKALHRQRDTFINNAAHELRNPLANLKTRLYLLKRQPEKLHEHLEIVERATDHMSELVQDLVDLAHFTKGQLQLNRRPIDLHHVIQSALSIQQAHAFRVRVGLKKELTDSPIYIHADHQRLMQTFNNLIANAIQATTPDGQVEITVSMPNNGHSQWVTIQIHNNGPTLDQEHLALIFEPFFRPSEGDVRRTGMDLAISKQIIEEHGGSISVSSRPAEGTTFTIQLPLYLSEPNSAN